MILPEARECASAFEAEYKPSNNEDLLETCTRAVDIESR